jgi:hypothetical protein
MDKLKELLGEELFSQVKEKIGDVKIMIDDGNFIPKARFDQVNEEKKELKEMLKERDKQLEDIKKKAKDSEDLTAQIKELQDLNQKTVTEYEAKLAKQSFNFALEQALAKDGANPVKAVKALLDLDRIKQDGETLIGYDEQIKTLKETYGHLFGANLKGRDPNPTNTPPPPQDNPWKPETFNLTKQGKILKEDPELAKRLKQAAGVE